MVVGASSGIGAAVARALGAEGAHVALAARREDVLFEVQNGLESGDGQESIVVTTDVADGEQVRLLVERAEQDLGPVDILVNCAGVMYFTLMQNVREEEWERTGTHSESGSYSVDRWLAIYAEHSHEHADQIRRARRGED